MWLRIQPSSRSSGKPCCPAFVISHLRSIVYDGEQTVSFRQLRGQRTRCAMDDYVDETMLELDRFAIGQPVQRSEDPVLLRGEGHYADDVSLPGQAYAVMARSGYAHGVI